MKWFALVFLVAMPALADIPPRTPEAPPPAPDVAQADAAAKPADAQRAAEEAAPAPTPTPAAEHPGGNQNAPGMQQPMGVIEGGWSYVYAAWGAAILGLLVYGASLFLRRSETPPPGAP